MQKRSKSEPPKISIIIPSFNKGNFIKKTLDSIVCQNYPNLEVIIQDPGSTDGSLEIIGKYVKKYPRIFKLFKEKDEGQLDAINRGLKKAKGEILSFINADDVYEDGALEKVGEYFFQNPNTLWLAGRGRVINEAGFEIAKFVTLYKNILLRINCYFFLLMTNYLFQPSVFLSRSAWEKYGPFKGKTRFVMEYEMWLRIGKDKMPSLINETLSSFRIPGKSISRDEFDKTLEADFEIVKTYTNSRFLLLLHQIHNGLRKLIIKII